MSSAYNPESNGLAESGVKQVKTLIKKTGDKNGLMLDKRLWELNAMNRADGSGSPLELLMGRTVNSGLPNNGGKSVNLVRDREMRRRAQERWRRKLGRVSKEEFMIGDLVSLHHIKSKKWNIKGMVDEIREVQEGEAKSYLSRPRRGEPS